jgi:hypothetical protein
VATKRPKAAVAAPPPPLFVVLAPRRDPRGRRVDPDDEVDDFVACYPDRETAERAARRTDPAGTVIAAAPDGAAAELDAWRGRVTALRAERAARSARFREEFSRGCRRLFSLHPRLNSFSFTAYTPFFNDGDECEFGVSRSPHNLNGAEYEQLPEADREDGYDYRYQPRFERVPNGKPRGWAAAARDDIGSFLDTLDTYDVRRMVSGDDSVITAHRKPGPDPEVAVEPYTQHD